MGIQIVAENRKARHDYQIEDTFEAGLQLRGSEVKALRERSVQLKDSYVMFQGDEAFLQNAHISEFKASSYNNHHPERLRKLLMNRAELEKLSRLMRERGYSLIPLKIYFKKGWAKLEIALAKGKKAHDKRESIKGRDVKRQLSSALRKNR